MEKRTFLEICNLYLRKMTFKNGRI